MTRLRRRPRRTLLLCPKCGAARVSLIAGSIVGQMYHCSNCDYVGSLVFETDVPEEEGSTGESGTDSEEASGD